MCICIKCKSYVESRAVIIYDLNFDFFTFAYMNVCMCVEYLNIFKEILCKYLNCLRHLKLSFKTF